MDDNLKNIETFFKLNMEIKKLMFKCAPNDTDNYNIDFRIKYGDKLYFALEDMLDYFKKLFNILNINHLNNDLENFFKNLQSELFKCDYNFNKLKAFYQTRFSNMDLNLINKVKETFVGYSLFNSIESVFSDAKTINELLHVLHSYILNNENIYQSMPLLVEREILNGENIKLYGKQNEIAKNFFQNIPVDLNLGNTDIISLDNKIIMMIRDLGHALTIEIDIENNKCMVKYFIPKMCNPKKVKLLKGINKINENVRFANGQFECNIEDLNTTLYTFLDMVPTDNDMFLEGGWYYSKDALKRLTTVPFL